MSWLVLAVAAVLAGGATGTDYTNSMQLKGTQSSQAVALLQSAAPRMSGDSDQLVIATHGHARVTDPAVRSIVSTMLSQVAAQPHVGEVASPYAAHGADQISRHGTVAYATVPFDQDADTVPLASVKHVIAAAQSANSSRLEVKLGGPAVERASIVAPGALLYGIIAATIVLIVVFGSPLAALLPLLTAGFALITGSQLIGVLSNVISMPDFSSQLALLIGLGVGVDYALFIVTRYR